VPSSILPAQQLRPGLLDGVRVLVAGARELARGERMPVGERAHGGELAEPALAHALEAACNGLGARVRRWSREQAPDEDTDVLVVDAGGAFVLECAAASSAGPEAGRAALGACLDSAWAATSAVANAAFIAPARGGRAVYVAPTSAPHGAPSPRSAPPVAPVGALSAAELREGARAGLENLARTLSIEWARHGVTTVAIAPGEHTAPEQVAAIVAYLASPAGAYFSGCLLDLRGPGALAPPS
jgi:NAD(P)-dependent dehydrogenase (short-subunit alcohol dehydrogenase family)